MKNTFIIACTLTLGATAVFAGEAAFTKGPRIEGFGPVAGVDATFEIPEGVVIRHSFDVGEAAEAGELNRTLVSAARFLNMHARAGVAGESIELAVVVHGKAVHDVAKPALEGARNENADLVKALQSNGVQIIVCGQSAVYYDVATDDLLPGVQMALSAMTAHALLQQDGFTVNPF